MTNYLTQILFFTVLTIFGAQFPQETTSKYLVSGRILDEQGKPVAHAVVTINPTKRAIMNNRAVIDDLIANYETDAEGRFRIEGESSFPSVQKAVLYARTPLPPNVYAPITQPFGDAKGQIITIKKNAATDVGDIPLSVRYGTIITYLQDCSGKPLLTENNQWRNVALRVRDAQGDIIVNNSHILLQAIHEDDSSFAVALPQGTWHIELSLNGKGNSWVALNQPITLTTTASLRSTLRIHASENQSKTSCTRNRIDEVQRPDTAIRELQQLGIPFSKDSFVERATLGNVNAVRLFLAAGMNPNVRDKHGNTALIAASGNGHGDIVKLLLDKEADISAINANGDTPLIAAASFGSNRIVRTLLQKGANPNVRANNGVTPLIVAAGNNHIEVVETLLAAGADVDAKDNEGTTALEFAIQSENEKLIHLLKKVNSDSTKPKLNQGTQQNPYKSDISIAHP